MKAREGLLAILLLFLQLNFVGAQSESLAESVSESRNRNIKYQLDLRFRGGSGEFERVFFANINYPEDARKACIMGVTIMSFKVSCDNKISDFRLKNPLGYGINEQLGRFFTATEGQWNSCTDDKYTRFEIPVLFIIESGETSGKGYLMVEGKYPGYKCKPDAYYLAEFEKLKAKKKMRKALEAVDELMRRDPFNNDYYDLKKALLESGKEDTKKSE